MASSTLLPPIVDSYLPAFVASGSLRFYFSLSKYSSSTSNIKSVHVSVVKQSTGQSVVNKNASSYPARYRASGIIIINTPPAPITNKSNLYYVDIYNEDVMNGDEVGWKAGWTYKIQIRLSTVAYDGETGQTAWLNSNASSFSEWSTYCTTKAIGKSTITVPLFKNYNSDVDEDGDITKIYTLDSSTLEFKGEYSNTDASELLYSYRLKLFSNTGILLEDTGDIYTNEYYNPNQLVYLFKTEIKIKNIYNLNLSYTTINKYSNEVNYKFDRIDIPIDPYYVYPITIDNLNSITDPDFIEEVTSLTSKEMEEEEGRILIKLYADDDKEVNKNICIRRADSRDNFQTWTDIKIINCINEKINNLAPIFDYTIESGVWYKYGAQIIDTNGYRNTLQEMENPLLREFEYGFLLGENGCQLKLKFDNTMNSYTYNYSEGKVDTIGGQYPFISRNGAMKYRSFPVNGLISFNMDEAEIFTSDEQLYKYEDIIKLYQDRRNNENIHHYDYKREFDFREKVLAFLYDGKPKLFKSSTEGNVIVRLMQVSAQPNQTLHRMIYSFTSTAYEIAEATMENYIKYGFYTVGDYISSFVQTKEEPGEIDATITPVPVNSDLIQLIWDKYQLSDSLKIKTLKEIKDLRIEFDDALEVINSIGDTVFGSNFDYTPSGKNPVRITVLHQGDVPGIYVFDSSLSLTNNDSIILRGEGNGTTNQPPYLHIKADFTRFETITDAKEPIIDTREIIRNLGQVFGIYKAGDNIYNEIYYKYYFDYIDGKNYLGRINSICIEAPVGSVFKIKNNSNVHIYDIGDTGILNISDFNTNIKDIIYLGHRNEDGTIDTTTNINLVLDYYYYLIKLTYRRE